jgi:hypothetical protein
MIGLRAEPKNPLFIDTNLLLVLLIGLLDPDQVERFKRTRAYTREDYLLLSDFVGGFDGLVTTPNVLTEVSNLAGSLSEPLRGRAFATLGALTADTDEVYCPSIEVVQHPSFPKLGLTDASVLVASQQRVTVLTDDFDLAAHLSSRGVSVVNFNHVRSGAWG